MTIECAKVDLITCSQCVRFMYVLSCRMGRFVVREGITKILSRSAVQGREGEHHNKTQQHSWLGRAMASAASRGNFALQLVSPLKLTDAGEAHTTQDPPTLVVRAEGAGQQLEQSIGAGSPTTKADISLSLSIALAAASQRRSKVRLSPETCCGRLHASCMRFLADTFFHSFSVFFSF